MSSIVSIRNVSKDYQLGKTTVSALRSVDLAVEQGDFISIAGPSGSGKTTLLNLIGCVDVCTSGEVKIAGHDTQSLRERQLTDLRLNTIGFIFQSFNLVSVLTVFQNVEFPLLLQRKLNRAERARARARAARQSGAYQSHEAPSQRAVGRTTTTCCYRTSAGDKA